MAVGGNLSPDAATVPFLKADALLLGVVWLDALEDEAEEGAEAVEAGFVDEGDGFEVEEALPAFMMHC